MLHNRGIMPHWIDAHCHLDAPEFAADRIKVRAQAAAQNVAICVIPAVQAESFAQARACAHEGGDAYALGIHPLYVPQAQDLDLAALDAALERWQDDPRLVAVGEMGLDYFVPALCEPAMRARQWAFYTAQLRLARKHRLPVILHVRRSADMLLKGLRSIGGGRAWQGIAHAFNGSPQQAQAFMDLGFKLGFGGAVTFERALHLRHLAQALPLEALVLETDAPDMPPHWLYTTAHDRQLGVAQGRNAPGELPRIAEAVAALRGISVGALAEATRTNACQALPRLAALLV